MRRPGDVRRDRAATRRAGRLSAVAHRLRAVGLFVVLSAATITAPPNATPADAAAPAPPPRVTFTSTTADLGGDRRAVAGDFNGDSVDDLVWFGPGAEDELALGTSTGVFTTIALTTPARRTPVRGDFNGDGYDDLLWHGPGTDHLALGNPALGEPGGSFTTTDLTAPDGRKALPGDFNGDGNGDIVWYGPGPDDRLDLGASGATFTTTTVAAPDDRTPLPGDFDGDGNDDALWYAAGSRGDPVLYGSGAGTFTRSPQAVDGTFRPFPGDFDGDGRTDVFWFGPRTTPDETWYGNADRSFTHASTSIGGDRTPIVANFNESGTDVRTDVLWYGAGAATDRLWLGTGTRGTFATSTVTRGGQFAVVTGDFDGSSGADVLWHRPSPGSDQLWLSTRRPHLTVETFLDGADLPDGNLGVPWDLAWTPDGALLFDERSGDLNLRLADGTIRELTADQSDLYATGEGGMLGLAIDPGFATNRRFYSCQGQREGSAYDIQVVGWQLDAGYTTATRVADPLVGGLPVASPTAASPGRHSGCRLRFGPDGFLWIGTGDTASPTLPQDRSSLGGKILRVVASTGAAAPGNPFVGDADPGTDPRVYNYGHRNVQGLALRPGTSQMWSVEHGTFRDDEVNLLAAGANYGWDPVPASGPLFYDESQPMTDLVRHPDAVAARRSSGNPTNAWSGAQFLTGAQWGTWEGALAVAALKDSQLHVMFFTDDGTFIRQEIPAELDGTEGRLRTPMLGPDGSLYLTTSESSGNRILRVTPT
jgi:glucose/arabinose dehydrogenase